MKRYQLAKLVEWAGTLESRKRMQKVVFMLKAKGCSLDTDFILHRYGPYSSDLSRLTDEMVSSDLLDETEIAYGLGRSKYNYKLSEKGAEQVSKFEKTNKTLSADQDLEAYESLARKLLSVDLRELEVASTIVYYRQQNHDWETAKTKAFQFKSVNPSTPFAKQAEELARTILT